MSADYVVVDVARFNAGRIVASILSNPLPRKEAEIEAAWAEHDLGCTTKVIPRKEITVKALENS